MDKRDSKKISLSSASLLRLKKGETFGNFKIIRPLGRQTTSTQVGEIQYFFNGGTFEAIYLKDVTKETSVAELEEKGVHVVLKILPQEKEIQEGIQTEDSAVTQQVHSRFFNPFRLIMDNLSGCKYIPRPMVSSSHDSYDYYALEYAPGRDLEQNVKALAGLSMRMPVKDVLYVHLRVLGALAYMHDKGLVHGNVREDSIVITRTSEGFKSKIQGVKIVGFGAVQSSGAVIDQSRLDRENPYIDPNLYADPHVSPMNDLYSLGVTLYHVLTGKFPSSDVHVPPSQVLEQQPDFLDTIVYKLITRNHDDINSSDVSVAPFEDAKSALTALQNYERFSEL